MGLGTPGAAVVFAAPIVDRGRCVEVAGAVVGAPGTARVLTASIIVGGGSVIVAGRRHIAAQARGVFTL